jgi:hypothetical protein
MALIFSGLEPKVGGRLMIARLGAGPKAIRVVRMRTTMLLGGGAVVVRLFVIAHIAIVLDAGDGLDLAPQMTIRRVPLDDKPGSVRVLFRQLGELVVGFDVLGLPCREEVDHEGRAVREALALRNPRVGFPEATAGFPDPVRGGKTSDRQNLIDRGEALPSNIFGQRMRERLVIVEGSDNRWNTKKASEPGRSPTSLSDDDLESGPAAERPNQERLDDPVLSHGIRESFDGA